MGPGSRPEANDSLPNRFADCGAGVVFVGLDGGGARAGPEAVSTSGSSRGRGRPSGAARSGAPSVATGFSPSQAGAGPAPTTLPFAPRLFHKGTAAFHVTSSADAVPTAAMIPIAANNCLTADLPTWCRQ